MGFEYSGEVIDIVFPCDYVFIPVTEIKFDVFGDAEFAAFALNVTGGVLRDIIRRVSTD